jgi:hypothetical protein
LILLKTPNLVANYAEDFDFLRTDEQKTWFLIYSILAAPNELYSCFTDISDQVADCRMAGVSPNLPYAMTVLYLKTTRNKSA